MYSTNSKKQAKAQRLKELYESMTDERLKKLDKEIQEITAECKNQQCRKLSPNVSVDNDDEPRPRRSESWLEERSKRLEQENDLRELLVPDLSLGKLTCKREHGDGNDC